MAQGSSIYMHLKQGLEVDLRSLALTRILFGLVIVFDLFFRLDDLTFFIPMQAYYLVSILSGYLITDGTGVFIFLVVRVHL
jgi:hypothetical protein